MKQIKTTEIKLISGGNPPRPENIRIGLDANTQAGSSYIYSIGYVVGTQTDEPYKRLMSRTSKLLLGINLAVMLASSIFIAKSKRTTANTQSECEQECIKTYG